jgi:hypothetical protein
MILILGAINPKHKLPNDSNQTPRTHDDGEDLPCVLDGIYTLDVIPFYDEFRRQDEI